MVPELPDDIWMDIIFLSGFDDVWTLTSTSNVDHVFGRHVKPDEWEYNHGDPWFFIGVDEVFEELFKRPAPKFY